MMFSNCTSLTTAPYLQAVGLGESCYEKMFANCTSLTTLQTTSQQPKRLLKSVTAKASKASALPAVNLSAHCYDSMFRGCTGLTDISSIILNSTSMKEGCYKGMFEGCNKIEKAPDLPSDSLAADCYKGMFSGCTSLREGPELGAESLEPGCYDGLFKGCSSLVKVTIKASSLEGCEEIISGCNNISIINLNIEEWTDEGWMKGFNPASSVTLVCPDTVEVPQSHSSLKPINPQEYAESFQLFCLVSKQDNSTVKLLRNGSPENVPLQFFKGDTVSGDSIWTSFDFSAPQTITLNSGEKLFIKADRVPSSSNTFSTGNNDYYQFVMTGEIEAEGNIMWLLDETAGTTTVPNYAFYKLFSGCTALSEADIKLTGVSVGKHSYENMFEGCSSIKGAPELPATVLDEACYLGMFKDCKKLEQTPVLKVTDLATSCYESMFEGCETITTTPELPAINLTTSCYKNMFKGCTKLTSVTSLSAGQYSISIIVVNTKGSLAESCYEGMFSGCTALTTAPKLPAVYLKKACYKNMFSGCSKLAIAPDLEAGTSYKVNDSVSVPLGELAESCYEGMFSQTSLKTAPILNSNTVAPRCYANMFEDCSLMTTGCLLPAQSMASHCYDSMFKNCVLLNENVNVQASILAEACCLSMFEGCTAFDITLDLKAKNLVADCYDRMFYGCTSLKSLAVGFEAVLDGAIDNWLYGINTTGQLFGSSSLNISLPSGWTIEEIGKVDDSKYFYFIAEGSVSISLTKSSNPDNISLLYTVSDDVQSATWHEYTTGNEISLSSGQQLFFKAGSTGNEKFSKDGTNYYKFVITGDGKASANGNIMCLLDSSGTLKTVPDYAFNRLFLECSKLTKCPDLPASTLGKTCYAYMFKSCTSLIEAPALPAMTLAETCYNNMFYGCTGLLYAPELPATTLAKQCYISMFSGCSSIRTDEKHQIILPYATLAEECYKTIFQDCVGIKDITVKATNLKVGTKNSFANWIKGMPADADVTIHCTQSFITNIKSEGVLSTFAIDDSTNTVKKGSANCILANWKVDIIK